MYPQYRTPGIGGICIMKYSYAYKKQCVELYRQSKWAETPNGTSEREFRQAIREWFRAEEACGSEALQHNVLILIYFRADVHLSQTVDKKLFSPEGGGE